MVEEEVNQFTAKCLSTNMWWLITEIGVNITLRIWLSITYGYILVTLGLKTSFSQPKCLGGLGKIDSMRRFQQDELRHSGTRYSSDRVEATTETAATTPTTSGLDLYMISECNNAPAATRRCWSWEPGYIITHSNFSQLSSTESNWKLHFNHFNSLVPLNVSEKMRIDFLNPEVQSPK